MCCHRSALALVLVLTVVTVGGCRSDTSVTGDAGAPPVWDREALHLGQGHRFSILLREEGREFTGWIHIRFGTGGTTAEVQWSMGASQGTEEVRLDPAGQAAGLLALSDPFPRSLLAATLLSEILDHPVTLVEGWTGSYAWGEYAVDVSVTGQKVVGPSAGYVTGWQLRGDDADMAVEAVLDPDRALPLAVTVSERFPGDYVLEVALEGLD